MTAATCAHFSSTLVRHRPVATGMSVPAIRPRGNSRGRRACVRSLLAALPLIAAGCTTYHAAPLAPDRSAAAFTARRLGDRRVRTMLGRLLPQTSGAWPPSAWNRAQLLAAALAFNPDLAVARAEVRAAVAHEQFAAVRPDPDLKLRSEYARHDARPWLYGLSVNWLLRSRERRRLHLRIAEIDASAAELRLMDRIWSVRAALDAALSAARGARRRLGLVQRRGAALKRLFDLQKARVGLGEDPPGELYVLQQARSETQQQAAELRAQVAAADAGTARSLGMPQRALDGVRVVWPDWGDPPPIAPEALRRATERELLSRADLGAAIDVYDAAEARLKLEVARQYPQFNLGPGYYWDHGIAKFPFNLGFTLPLHHNAAAIAAARAQRDLAAERMLALQTTIQQRIDAARRAEDGARSALDAARQRLDAARRGVRQADLELKLGESDAARDLEARVSCVQARIDVVQSRAALQDARDALESALHAPLSGPELALDGFRPGGAFGGGR